MPKASEIVEVATKDKGEGANKRNNANGFAWAQILRIRAVRQRI